MGSLAEEATRPLALIVFSALLGLLFCVYYRFIHSPYQAFVGTGVKGPRPKFLLGSSLEYKRLGELQMYHKFYRTYGPVFGFYLGTRPVVVVADPTLLDLVLAADCHSFTTTQQKFVISTLNVHGLPSLRSRLDDEDAQKARKTFRSTLLLPKLLKLMVPVVLHSFDSLLQKTLEKCADSSSVDIWNVYQPYCLHVILNVLGLSSAQYSHQITAAVTSYFNAINRNGSSELLLRFLLGVVPCLGSAMRSLSRQARAELEFTTLVGVVSEAIYEARQHHQLQQTGIKRNYLQVLLDHPLTDDQVTSYCLLTLLIGYHTVSSCLSYTTYQLAAHPLEQRKLYSEVSGSVERETLFYETVDSFEFLDAVVQESLRLHCLTPKLSRVCVKDCSVKGTTIRRGTRVEIPVNFIHHHYSYWDNPHSFCPNRFAIPADHKAKRPASSHHTFVPFGRGSHSCLGMRFTVTCVKLSLTEIVQRFKFSKAPNAQDPVEIQQPSCPARRPATGLHVKVMKRHKPKKQMSFASVVQTAMGRQTIADADSP